MLNARYLREHPALVRTMMRRRYDAESDQHLEEWLALDARRRDAAKYYETYTTANRGLYAAKADAAGATDTSEAMRAVEDGIAEGRRAYHEMEQITQEVEALLRQLPNLPDPRVPNGRDANANVELARWGEQPRFKFARKAHDELAKTLGMIDLPRATTLSGPRFPLFIDMGARLVRALGNFMLDLHTQAGYVEVMPPHLLLEGILTGSGHLPRHVDDLYAIPADGLYLSPTAEAQLVALHAYETLQEDELPRAYTAWTPCFRREAGSAGRATRGLLRQHQFEKVELVRITTPETADEAFDAIRAQAEEVLRRLELPYRVVALCAGELPFAAARTVDLEVWMPSLGHYVEVSSVSDCGTYQAIGLDMRYRQGYGPKHFPHTLNGSALAIGRTLAALLENGQRAGGSVALPAALGPYLPDLPDLVLR